MVLKECNYYPDTRVTNPSAEHMATTLHHPAKPSIQMIIVSQAADKPRKTEFRYQEKPCRVSRPALKHKTSPFVFIARPSSPVCFILCFSVNRNIHLSPHQDVYCSGRKFYCFSLNRNISFLEIRLRNLKPLTN